jgi:hypothetical protein
VQKPMAPTRPPLQPPMPPDPPRFPQQSGGVSASDNAQKAVPPKRKLETQQVFKLEYPVTFAGVDYTQLIVRRLKAKDFRMADTIEGGPNAQAIAMAALICNVDEAVIDELDGDDYIKLQEMIKGFFQQGLGGKSPATAGE